LPLSTTAISQSFVHATFRRYDWFLERRIAIRVPTPSPVVLSVMANQVAVASPPANIYESPDQITVAIPIPGAHHDTVSVALDGQRLTVDAEARYPQEQQHYVQHEWSVGTSHREIDLPRPVRGHGAKATLTHGILTISLPIGGEDRSLRIAIPVTEPAVHQGQPH
jgi:HSP20 family molecular chaperone IbpA